MVPDLYLAWLFNHNNDILRIYSKANIHNLDRKPYNHKSVSSATEDFLRRTHVIRFFFWFLRGASLFFFFFSFSSAEILRLWITFTESSSAIFTVTSIIVFITYGWKGNFNIIRVLPPSVLDVPRGSFFFLFLRENRQCSSERSTRRVWPSHAMLEFNFTSHLKLAIRDVFFFFFPPAVTAAEDGDSSEQGFNPPDPSYSERR